MGTKLINLSELSSVLQEKEKTGNSVLNFSKQFKLGHILRSLSHIKQQGYSLLCLTFELYGSVEASISEACSNRFVTFSKAKCQHW